nr:hypothetical protein [Desulfobacterales bacterium]
AAGMLLAKSSLILLEVGPGQTLTKLIRQHPARRPEHQVLSGLPLGEKTGDRCAVLDALGRLWCSGVEVDWLALQGATPGRRVPLPTYPFDRKRFWIEPTDETGMPHPEPPVNVDDVDDSIIADGPGIKAGSLEKIIHKQLHIMVEQLEAIGRSRKSE